jgi:hypothetical protein
MNELVKSAASVVTEQKMGWLRKNQYLGAIEGWLVSMGMKPYEAASLKNIIGGIADVNAVNVRPLCCWTEGADRRDCAKAARTGQGRENFPAVAGRN